MTPPAVKATLDTFRLVTVFSAAGKLLVFNVTVPAKELTLVRVMTTLPLVPCGTFWEKGEAAIVKS